MTRIKTFTKFFNAFSYIIETYCIGVKLWCYHVMQENHTYWLIQHR